MKRAVDCSCILYEARGQGVSKKSGFLWTRKTETEREDDRVRTRGG